MRIGTEAALPFCLTEAEGAEGTPRSGGSGRADPTRQIAVVERILERSVRVEVRYLDQNGRLHLRSGCGVSVGDGAWLTCAHLLPSGAPAIVTVWDDGAQRRARVLYADDAADRMWLAAERSEGKAGDVRAGPEDETAAGDEMKTDERTWMDAPTVAQRERATWEYPALSVGAGVWVVGLDERGRTCLGRGRVTGISERSPVGSGGGRWLTLDVYARPGYSGGGVFDAEGRLLGIVCGKTQGAKDDRGTVWASALLCPDESAEK
ncbi:MAG: trypsin-like peptidase domain-containing protein [Clostridia bacterium]|nr:trypsin-like peptidase domain-containing protein [Clostridia bacterium]